MPSPPRRAQVALGAMLAVLGAAGACERAPRATEPASSPPGAATAGAPRTVTLTITGHGRVQGFTLRVTYPRAIGDFAGSADAVACTTTLAGFTPNDRDDGSMLLVAGSAAPLALPATITCTFDQTAPGSLAAVDLTAVVQSVTVDGRAGRPGDLAVTVDVSS